MAYNLIVAVCKATLHAGKTDSHSEVQPQAYLKVLLDLGTIWTLGHHTVCVTCCHDYDDRNQFRHAEASEPMAGQNLCTGAVLESTIM